jgi:hypothetical protein
MNVRALCALAISVVVAATAAGCEKTDHENIEKWMGTEQGPGKLKKALADSGLDADLSAHAAENMVRMGNQSDVRAAFAAMSPERATAVTAKLAPRLWERARVEGEATVPTPLHSAAKDILFELRKYADDPTRQQIDGYLIDWYAVSFYDKRATLGSNSGAKILRELGPAAAERIMQAANAVVAPPEQNGQRVRIGDELLLGLAVTGSPAAVKYVLDVAVMDRGDDTLAQRASEALLIAYVDPGNDFAPADPAALAPNLPALIDLAKNDRFSSRTNNNAVALIRTIGMPACLPALVALIGQPHADLGYKYLGASNALKCGGAKAVRDVARALPTGSPYAAGDLGDAVWKEIAMASPREEVLAALRELLKDPSWVARWIAIEALAAMKSTADIAGIKALSGDKARLTGYWGEQENVDPSAKKKDPTLGQRATELVTALGG